jgi:hypothetical protein
MEPLLLHVWVRSVEPVSGQVALDGRRAAAFEGWLHLLQRLSELVASARRATERPLGGSGSVPRAEFRDRDVRAATERTDHGSGMPHFIRNDWKEET